MQITKIIHTDQKQAILIWQLFHDAYKIEAQILGLHNFPPLKRTIRDIQEAKTIFYGGWQASTLIAAMEIEAVNQKQFHVNSFGVSSTHFRQGFGSELLAGVLDKLDWRRATVSTAVANTQALNLYQKHGFQPQKQWTTPDNIPMMTLSIEK